jgi:biopolymer transport protein ExbB/TolQ/biopolymer transport protein ExbD
MRHKRVKPAELFCSMDRTPFLAVSATLFAIFLFALMLTNGLPRLGPSDLPKVNNPLWMPDADRDDAIVLVVMRNGSLFWRQDPISMDDLRQELCHRLERDPQAQVFLAVDAHTNYGNVSTVLAAVRSVGAERIVFLVDQRKTIASWATYPQPGFWNVDRFWRSMDRLNQADFLLLAFMLANTGAILGFRLYRFNAARRESRTFMRNVASPLREGRFDEVIRSAAQNERSHVAHIVAEVVAAYASAAPNFTNAEAIALAERTSQRRSKLLAARLKCGRSTFATIAASAPFIGFLGTINGIVGSFTGTTGPPSVALARLASQLAGAVLLGALGIVVSIVAVWCFYYVRSRSKVLETEMSNAEVEAVTYLKAHPQWREQLEPSFAATGMFSVADASAGRSWEVPYDRQRPLLLAFWCCALYVAYLLAQAWW